VTPEPDIELIVRIVLRVLDHLGPRPEWSTSRTPDPDIGGVNHSGRGPKRSTLITERDVMAAIPTGRLEMAPGAVVTPLARDTAQEKGVELVEVG
jgi:hypothetical protein